MTVLMTEDMSAVTKSPYPHPWGTELVRNPSGRAFWFCSRFVSRTRVEYIKDVSGRPKCFRSERAAVAAVAQRNAIER